MKKTMKHIISYVLVLAMIISIIPPFTAIVEAEPYTGADSSSVVLSDEEIQGFLDADNVDALFDLMSNKIHDMSANTTSSAALECLDFLRNMDNVLDNDLVSKAVQKMGNAFDGELGDYLTDIITIANTSQNIVGVITKKLYS